MSSEQQVSLGTCCESLVSLIKHCRSSLTTTSRDPAENSIQLLHEAATLTKTQITRLSIALRPPSSPDVAGPLISELTTTIVPSLASAAAAVHASREKLGYFLVKDAVSGVDGLLAALEEYSRGVGAPDGRLTNTGVVWKAADHLLGLSDCAATVDKILRMSGELIKDAGDELMAWVDEQYSTKLQNDNDSAWDSGITIELVRQAARAVEKTRTIEILFTVARKRLSSASVGGSLLNVSRLDAIAQCAKDLERLVDEMGVAFYEGDEDDVARAQKEIELTAVEIANILEQGDISKGDRFTSWLSNFKAALK